MYIDSHIHLSHRLYDNDFPYIGREEDKLIVKVGNRRQLIDELKSAGVEFTVEPGIGFDSNEKILEIAKEYKGFIYPAVGVHPTRTPHTEWSKRKELEELSKTEGIVAIGELGLDYHLDRKEQHRIKQLCWFIWQIKLADRRGLPLILHIRMAHKDAIRVLRFYKKKIHGGVCHCFVGGVEEAKIYTEEMGLMLGIGGSILYEGEQLKALEDAVRNTPLEKIVLETDGPYVKPDKFDDSISGKKWRKIRNTSLIIPEVAKKVAKLKGISTEEVMKVTSDNVRRLTDIGAF